MNVNVFYALNKNQVNPHTSQQIINNLCRDQQYDVVRNKKLGYPINE